MHTQHVTSQCLVASQLPLLVRKSDPTWFLLDQWMPNNGPHGSIARRTPEYLIGNDIPRLVFRIDQNGTSITVYRNWDRHTLAGFNPVS